VIAIDVDTEGAVGTVPVRDRDGRWYMLVSLKHAFKLTRNNGIERIEPEPFRMADTFNGDDGAASSIRRPSQLFDSKPGTDVVLLGHAHPVRGGDGTYADVTLKVGAIDKTIRAYGLRTWTYSAFGGLTPGPARAIRDPIPLIYELARGGSDTSDPEKPLGEPRNLVGRGVTRNAKQLLGQPANQLEYPDEKSTPAAFNPIHRHWTPRASYAGTYDEHWQESRMPLLPSDFDERFHVCVAHDQWSLTPLRSDEPITVLNATEDGEWAIQLPRFAPGFSSVVMGRGRQEHRTHLDTILIDADERTVELTWRARVPMPKKLEMIERLIVFEKQVL
jgi:hypothetical protein